MQKVEAEYQVKVLGVCTDNAASTNLMRQKLGEQTPGISTWGCSDHLLNLLGRDITPASLVQPNRQSEYTFLEPPLGKCLAAENGTVKPHLPVAQAEDYDSPVSSRFLGTDRHI